MKDNISKLCIPPGMSVLEAIKVMDETHERIVLIVDGGRLQGVFTDSDVRKWILKSGDLKKSITEAMTASPLTVAPGEEARAALIMEKKGLDAVPVVDPDGMLLDLIFRYESEEEAAGAALTTDAPVVIMAGGKGERLYPYTQVLPKPLIPIGKTTIIEQVIESFRRAGCSDFCISVNYRKNLIKAFFQDMCPEYDISFIEEEHFLGTAGSLYLVKDRIREPFFVSNCDILIHVDYGKVMRFHKEQGNAITLITSLKNYTIPYGVAAIGEDGQLEDLSEKPEMNFLVNTGVYVLDPGVLDIIKPEVFMHITDLIRICMDRGDKVGAYPVTEKAWEDMGEIAGMESMIREREMNE